MHPQWQSTLCVYYLRGKAKGLRQFGKSSGWLMLLQTTTNCHEICDEKINYFYKNLSTIKQQKNDRITLH